MQIKIEKWKGTKNSDTGEVTQGYLWISFLEDTTIINTNPIYGRVMAPSYYKKGQKIGFPIHNAANRQQALKQFRQYYNEPETAQ